MTKIILIAQQKGGAGKSTIAAHLAIGMMLKGYKTALIDTDPQQTLTQWHQKRSEIFGPEFTGINFINCKGIYIANELTRLKGKADYIIIDSPPHIATELKMAIRYADLVVVPMQPSPTDLWATGKTMEIIEQQNKPSLLILNRVPPKAKITQEIIKKLGRKNLYAIGNRTIFASSIYAGKTAIELQPHSASSDEIKKILNSIEQLFLVAKQPIKETSDA